MLLKLEGYISTLPNAIWEILYEVLRDMEAVPRCHLLFLRPVPYYLLFIFKLDLVRFGSVI